ncbi:thiamine-phosphate kinase [Novosphingobium sp. ZN18A2]|uniref:thiamine-phosphate kinase n=1 Tax=Novosphingobium sp. ZN18A2 TaxID=3079861 RepID=UPI0030D3FB00
MSREADFIDGLRALATSPAARGLEDDAAVLDIGGESIVLTHDAMVEGVHWLAGQDPADVAWKLVAVNLSDLAAKGAEPVGVLLGYSFGSDDARFAEGLRAVLHEYGVPLLGGDTVQTPGPQSLGLTAIGRATHRPVPSRSGVNAGDRIFVTGPVGGAMMGFEAMRDGHEGADTLPYRRPVPMLAAGRAIAPLAHAMMDVSDGLLLDAGRMADASGVTIAIRASDVPLAPGIPPERRDDALRWGDDYQLLFALPPGVAPPCDAWPVGEAQPRGKASILLDGAQVTGHLGWQHGENG